MTGNKLRSPIIGATLFGVVCVSYIAYYFYKRSKRKSLMNRLKLMYDNDHELYAYDHMSDNEDPYEVAEPSDLSDYFLVQSSDPQTDVEATRDDNLKYEDFQEIAYIEDVAKEGKANKVYKILANPTLFNGKASSTPSTKSSALAVRGKSNRNKKDKSESSGEWTVLDNYSNEDGSAQEFTYVEKTVSDSPIYKFKINKTLEEVDLQKNKPLQVNVNNKCCNGSEQCCNLLQFDNETSGDLKLRLEPEEVEGIIETRNPESVKIYIKNFGCSHNMSDGEYMTGILHEYGYKIANEMEQTDLVIINSCTVKGPSEEGMVTCIKKANKLKLPVIVSGCVPQADKNNAAFAGPQISLLGVTQIDRIVEMVENSLMGRKMVLLEKKELPKLDLPKIRKNKFIEIIPLSTGCLGSCTFCKTKYSRGVLGSYDLEALLDRVEGCLSEGVKEIWLTSEDLGAYGIDIGTDIVTLLKSIVEMLPKDTMLRLGMSNPPYIKKHINEICNILLHENVYEFIHIPVQSGSDAVLESMNREYEIEDFLYLVDTIRNRVPNCTIATDIIAGFPTEKEEDHKMTLRILEELKLPVVNISQFYPRKGTVASKMKQLPNKVGKNRSREITKVFMSYETNSKYLNEVFKVYFNQINDHNQLIGHNKYYIKVILITGFKDIQNNNNNNNINSNNINNNNNNNNGNNNNGNNNNGNNNNIDNSNNNNNDNTNNNNNINNTDQDCGFKYSVQSECGESERDSGSVGGEVSDHYKNKLASEEGYGELVKKYFGTVQHVKIVRTTKWHLEGVICKI